MYMSRHRAWKKYGIVTQHPKKMEPVNAEYDRVQISRGHRREKFFPSFSFFFSLILSLSPSPCFLSFNSIHEQNFTRTFRDFSCLRNLQFPGRISRFGKIIIFRDRSLPIGNPRYTENVAQKIIPRSIAPVIVTWNKRTEKKEKKKTYKSKSRIGFFSDFCFFLSFFFFFTERGRKNPVNTRTIEFAPSCSDLSANRYYLRSRIIAYGIAKWNNATSLTRS